MIEAVFPYRAVSRPTQHLCTPAGRGRFTAHGVLMDAQRVFSGPQWIHSVGG